jgi:hypothetical protein
MPKMAQKENDNKKERQEEKGNVVSGGREGERKHIR